MRRSGFARSREEPLEAAFEALRAALILILECDARAWGDPGVPVEEWENAKGKATDAIARADKVRPREGA